MKRLVCLMVAAAMLLGLAACVPTTQPNEPAATAVPGANETAQPGDSTETPAAEEVSDDYLIWNIGMEPKTWDPQLNTSGPGGLVIINLYDGLVRDTKEGIKMATAESYEVSANAEGVADTVYTFKLRDDAKWSDGQSVTANDFEYAWKRACSPEMASPYAFLITDYIKGAYEYFSGTGSRDDVGVKALDEHTLQVELIQPTAYFLNLVSFFTYMPCREDMASTGEGWEKDPAKCITNGAFYLEEYKIGSHVLLKKNENFWNKDNVKLAGVKGLFITDATTSLQGYEAGEINITSTLPGEEIPRLLAEDPNFASEPALGTTYIEFNMDAEIVNDVNVRKALSLAIDRKLICDQVLRNGAVPAAAFVAPPFKLSTGESLRAMDEFGNVMTEYEINPNGAEVEKAREYLAAAGYPNGEGFPTLTLSYYDNDTVKKVVEAMAEMLKNNLNINVEVSSNEWSIFYDDVQKGNYQVAAMGWSADYVNPMSFLPLCKTGDSSNNLFYSNADYDALVDQVKAENDPAKAAELTLQADAIVSNDYAVLPLYYKSNNYLMHDNISGFYMTASGNLFFKDVKVG